MRDHRVIDHSSSGRGQKIHGHSPPTGYSLTSSSYPIAIINGLVDVEEVLQPEVSIVDDGAFCGLGYIECSDFEFVT